MKNFKIGDKCRACDDGKVDKEPSPFCPSCRVALGKFLEAKNKIERNLERVWKQEWHAEASDD